MESDVTELRISICKTEIMILHQEMGSCYFQVGVELLLQVEELKYLQDSKLLDV